MKKGAFFFIAAFFLFSLGGCATMRKQDNLEAQGLRNQISALETELQKKDQEIDSLKEALVSRESQEQVAQEKPASKRRIIGEVKSRPNIKQIQIALTNAGYNIGAIDGKMGKQTRDAIRSFQRTNNLAVDGKVGKKTWAVLKGYLYKKVK